MIRIWVNKLTGAGVCKLYSVIGILLFPATLFSQNTFPSSGNVGVGTSSPAHLLDVRGTIYTTGSVIADGGDIIINRTSHPYGYVVRPDVSGYKKLQFAVAGGGTLEEIILNSSTNIINGKLGIGTFTPRTRLDLGEIRLGGQSEFPAEGSISETDWANFIIGKTDLGQQLRLGVTNDSYTRAEIEIDNNNRADGTISLKTADGGGGAISRLFIKGNGNIGIGTTNPQSTLAVNGDVFAKKMKVTQTGWPDYVFEPGYQLMPLQKVAAYIKEYKHLPGIRSAKEIESGGLDLGDNQAALLKKIEELTLYLLDQQTVNESLQLTIAEKDKKMQELEQRLLLLEEKILTRDK